VPDIWGGDLWLSRDRRDGAVLGKPKENHPLDIDGVARILTISTFKAF
jgi:hypothetical protein